MSRENIINPVTTSGKILASTEGGPVLASTHPEWAAGWMLSMYMPLPLSFSNLATILFPETVQSFHDAAVEQFMDEVGAGALVKLVTTLPTPVFLIILFVGDLVACLSFIGFSVIAMSAPLKCVSCVVGIGSIGLVL